MVAVDGLDTYWGAQHASKLNCQKNVNQTALGSPS